MSGVLVSDLVSVSHGNTTHTIFIKITNTIKLNNTIFVKSIIIRIVRFPIPIAFVIRALYKSKEKLR